MYITIVSIRSTRVRFVTTLKGFVVIATNNLRQKSHFTLYTLLHIVWQQDTCQIRMRFA